MEEEDIPQTTAWQDGDHFSPDSINDVLSDDDSPYSQDFVIESMDIADEESIWTDFDEVISLGDKLMGFTSPPKPPKSRITPGPSQRSPHSKIVTRPMRVETQSSSNKPLNKPENDTATIEPKDIASAESPEIKTTRSKIPRLATTRPTSARGAQENVTTSQSSKRLKRRQRTRIPKPSSFIIDKLLLGESEDEGSSKRDCGTVEIKQTGGPSPSKSAENVKEPPSDATNDNTAQGSPTKRSKAWRHLNDASRLSSPPRYTVTPNGSRPSVRDGSVFDRERICFSPLTTLSNIRDESPVGGHRTPCSSTRTYTPYAAPRFTLQSEQFLSNQQNERATPDGHVRESELNRVRIGSTINSPLPCIDSPVIHTQGSPVISQESSPPPPAKQARLVTNNNQGSNRIDPTRQKPKSQRHRPRGAAFLEARVLTPADAKVTPDRHISSQDVVHVSNRNRATRPSLFRRILNIITCKSCTETTSTVYR